MTLTNISVCMYNIGRNKFINIVLNIHVHIIYNQYNNYDLSLVNGYLTIPPHSTYLIIDIVFPSFTDLFKLKDFIEFFSLLSSKGSQSSSKNVAKSCIKSKNEEKVQNVILQFYSHLPKH